MLYIKIRPLYISSLLYLLIFSPLIGNSNYNNVEKVELKTSVIIPCSYKHAKHIYAHLKIYQEQTVCPDEIIISISECHKVAPNILESLENESWLLPVIIIKSKKVQYAGKNRNIGCAHANGNIFILQDADDIPHPQRVEIIKYFFENYKINHLMHEFFRIYSLESKINFKICNDFKLIPFDRFTHIGDAYKIGNLTNGNVAISKKLFNKIQWSSKPRGQDTLFNKEVYSKFKNLVAIKIPLLCYREFLSSKN